jgi:hypothetical protein
LSVKFDENEMGFFRSRRLKMMRRLMTIALKSEVKIPAISVVAKPRTEPVPKLYSTTAVRSVVMFASMMAFLVRQLERMLQWDAAYELGLMVLVGVGSYTTVLYLMERDLAHRLLDILIPSRRTTS